MGHRRSLSRRTAREIFWKVSVQFIGLHVSNIIRITQPIGADKRAGARLLPPVGSLRLAAGKRGGVGDSGELASRPAGTSLQSVVMLQRRDA